MRLRRRDFIASPFGAGAAATQESRTPKAAPPSVPTRIARVVKLFKALNIQPKALEAADDGLWIGDQVSERASKG